jgi:elongation factor P
MIKATKIRVGNIILLDGDLYRVHSTDHRTPGKGVACMQTKLRNLNTGNMIDKRFNSDEKIEKAFLDTVEMEYLYKDDTGYVFMNTENFEQVILADDMVGDGKDFLLANTKVFVEFYEGNPVGVEFPKTVILKVVETEPFVKRATASAQTKPAVLETGLKVIVPGFVDVDQLIKVNTETSEYIARADNYDE